ncbi:Lar family restriction alleviation protein [Sphingomonas aerolata]|uniref:Lar family restriction alleviation protein n=1 Tax=Sphingomonas aerolata TaxID=185951 RepID=UPI00141B315D|nr:Lar family restriction alleviation protein [Sphingomonas aerolata]NII59797.1 hypothetical protein [Sphingomonas aerolata]
MSDARDQLSPHEQMLDAQAGCVPCKLCGGAAVVTDAGSGAGYHVRCGNSVNFRQSEGCLIDERSLSGWAYNIMDWWNRLHGEAPLAGVVALLPCPFCGSADAVLVPQTSMVECIDCGAIGPGVEGDDGAMLWNTRPASPPSSGHGLADPVAWEQEVGSVADTIASQVREFREGMRSAILRDLGADQKRYNEHSPTHRAFGFCIDIAAKAEV